MTFQYKLLTFLILILSFLACDEKDSPASLLDDGDVIINEEIYNSIKNENFTVSKASIVGDSLLLTICASGCSGESWKVTLVGSGMVAESFPEQSWAKVKFENKEACLASFCREYTFNIKPMRTGSGKLSLHLGGWDGALLYEY
jgi:hypothetical protein